MSKVPEVEYVLLTPEDWPDVIDLLETHFYTRENFRLGAGMNPAEAVTPREEKRIRDGLASGLSVGAREKVTRKLVAVLIGFIVTADSQHPSSTYENITNVQKRMNRVFENQPSFNDVFQEPGVDRVFQISRRCVHPDHGRRGVGSQMAQMAMDLAAKKGCQLAWSRTTSQYAEKSLLRLGFQSRSVLDLQTLEDTTLDLSRMSYHQLTVMTKRLQPNTTP